MARCVGPPPRLRIRYALQKLKEEENALDRTANPSEVQGKPKRTSEFHLVEPKTRQSRRTIGLPRVTLSALAEHKARQANERVLAGSAWKVPRLICEGHRVSVDDLVFVTRVGTPFDAPTVTHRFQALLKRAGIGHHRFHDLRHTAATLLAVQGIHLRAIQSCAWLGEFIDAQPLRAFCGRTASGGCDCYGIDFEPSGCQHGCQTDSRKGQLICNRLKRLVGPDGFEPSTNGL